MKKFKSLLLAFGLGILALFLFNRRTNDSVAIEKKKKKEKNRLLKIVNKDKKDRRSIRDKYSKIVGVILIICLFSFQVNAEYIVYDKEDKSNRDYGHYTNYIKSLEIEKDKLMKTQTKIILTSTNIINKIVVEYKPTFWERIDFEVGIISGLIFGILLSMLKG